MEKYTFVLISAGIFLCFCYVLLIQVSNLQWPFINYFLVTFLFRQFLSIVKCARRGRNHGIDASRSGILSSPAP